MSFEDWSNEDPPGKASTPRCLDTHLCYYRHDESNACSYTKACMYKDFT